jgi:hypothetical protein
MVYLLAYDLAYRGRMMTKKKFITTWFYAPVGHFDDVATSGFFWNKKRTPVKTPSQRTADYDAFAKQLEEIYNQFDSDGYDVHEVLPLNIGATESVHSKIGGKDNYVGETGFSVTRGAVVVGKLRV